MLNNSNIPHAEVGQKVVIGRMKGNIHVGDKIYKLSSKELLDVAKQSYSNEKIKLPLKCNISVKKDEPIVMEVSLQNLNYKLYKNINVKIQSTLIPEKALNNPISKDRIISQVCKTNDTPFEFAEINVELEDDVFIPSIKELNEIRRMAISKLEKYDNTKK